MIDLERAARILRVDVNEAADLADAIGASDPGDLSVSELEEMSQMILDAQDDELDPDDEDEEDEDDDEEEEDDDDEDEDDDEDD